MLGAVAVAEEFGRVDVGVGVALLDFEREVAGTTGFGFEATHDLFAELKKEGLREQASGQSILARTELENKP